MLLRLGLIGKVQWLHRAAPQVGARSPKRDNGYCEALGHWSFLLTTPLSPVTPGPTRCSIVLVSPRPAMVTVSVLAWRICS